MRLKGKTALVTAAGQGIGRASALALAAEGAQVLATDVNAKLLESYAGVANVRTQALDVLDRKAIDACVAGLPRIDVLFNCAGFVHNGTIEQATDAEWDFAFNLNCRSQFWMMQAALPKMVQGGGGSIINMASVCSIKGLPNRFIYSASKAAVIGITKSVAMDYVGKGVRCNAICPGTVDSPSLAERLKATGDYEAAKSAFISRQPMGRMARAEEIGMLVVYLASDEAAFVTGQTFVIDGGWSI